ncbi:MAG: hypothetical protein E6244_08795 [Actinomyces sp.]|nr:hypothetical protein [Actinomyces sp.]
MSAAAPLSGQCPVEFRCREFGGGSLPVDEGKPRIVVRFLVWCPA